MKTIVLISCVKKKLAVSSPAKDLYVSPLFRYALKYAYTLKPAAIFILSAKHGLLSLEETVEPYEQTLLTMSASGIKVWAENVKGQLSGKLDVEKDHVVFLAGEKYRKYLIPVFKNVSIPLKGLGIGKQLQFLKKYA